MKKIGIGILAGFVMFGAMASWAMAQGTSASYKSQLETALGGKIIAMQKTTRYPASSLTQVLNFTVDRGAGRTEVVPVQIVFVKAGTGYVVQSLYVLNTSPAMAATRATQLPLPEPGTGGGGGSGTTSTQPTRTADPCKTKCFTNPTGGPIDWVKAAACYMACLLGLPTPVK